MVKMSWGLAGGCCALDDVLDMICYERKERISLGTSSKKISNGGEMPHTETLEETKIVKVTRGVCFPSMLGYWTLQLRKWNGNTPPTEVVQVRWEIITVEFNEHCWTLPARTYGMQQYALDQYRPERSAWNICILTPRPRGNICRVSPKLLRSAIVQTHEASWSHIHSPSMSVDSFEPENPEIQTKKALCLRDSIWSWESWVGFIQVWHFCFSFWAARNR